MVNKSLEAKVRPLANPSLEKTSLLGAGRIYVSKDSFISLTGNLENARHCIVERLDDQPIRREASLWVLPGGGNLSPNVVMMSRAFQDAAGFKVGDPIRVSLSGDVMPDAESVTVQDVGEVNAEIQAPTKHLPCWEFSISMSLGMPPFSPDSSHDTDKHLDRAELVFPGMVLEGVNINKLRRSFKVVSVNSKSSNMASFKLASTAVQILQENEEKPPTDAMISGGKLVLTGVPGLAKQVKMINQFLKAFTRPFWVKGERESCAIALHGGSGTGKTFILRRLEATGWGRSFWIHPSSKLSSIRETFQKAREQQPSMIFIEQLGDILDKERSNRNAVIDSIVEELDALSALALANDALPRVVVIATCLDYLTDIPSVLQKSSRFLKNIALPIPRVSDRLEILEFLDPPIYPDVKKACLEDLAQKTHAYNAEDLTNLVTSAKNILADRLDEAETDISECGKEHFLTKEDMDNALRTTQPTAMHDINLKPPTIRWEDVGGQAHLKKVLARMISFAKVSVLLAEDSPKSWLTYLHRITIQRCFASCVTLLKVFFFMDLLAALRPFRLKQWPPSLPSTSSPSRALSSSTCMSASLSVLSAYFSIALVPLRPP